MLTYIKLLAHIKFTASYLLPYKLNKISQELPSLLLLTNQPFLGNFCIIAWRAYGMQPAEKP